jgi:redox-sensitive bicupin YhaK (pirin superfamily)
VQPLVRRAADRFLTRGDGVETRHVFSFGPHYDPAHVAHGPLVACDEHRLEPGAGFAPHPHRGLEVVSWVLEGVLLHEGPGGTSEVPAGTGQWLATGDGVTHAERAGSAPTRFVQTWLTSPGGRTSYQRLAAPRDRGLSEVGRRAGAVLHVGRVDGPRELPPAAYLHVLVLAGRLRVDGLGLDAGDSARLADSGAALHGDAQVLVWEMHTTHRVE